MFFLLFGNEYFILKLQMINPLNVCFLSWFRFLLHYSRKKYWKDIMPGSLHNQHFDWSSVLLLDDWFWKIWKWLEEDSLEQANINVSIFWPYLCLYSSDYGTLEIHCWTIVLVGLLCTGKYLNFLWWHTFLLVLLF